METSSHFSLKYSVSSQILRVREYTLLDCFNVEVFFKALSLSILVIWSVKMEETYSMDCSLIISWNWCSSLSILCLFSVEYWESGTCSYKCVFFPQNKVISCFISISLYFQPECNVHSMLGYEFCLLHHGNMFLVVLGMWSFIQYLG